MKSPRSSSPAAQNTVSIISLKRLFDPGDEVIIPSPYWVSYPDQVLLNDATPVIVETTEAEGFKLSAQKLEKAITKKTKALVLNSPSNPTGLAYDRKTLEEIAAIAVKHRIYVISDEIYEKLLYDGFTHFSIASLSPGIKDLTIVVNGVSKSHAMTGWRIGYAAGPKDVITAMANIQSQSTSNPCSISQKAALEALRGPQDFISDHEHRIRQKKKIYGGAAEQNAGDFLPDARGRVLRLSRTLQSSTENRYRGK